MRAKKQVSELSEENIKKILFVSPELAPFSKVGGLGDVVGSLPAAICKAGADVRVLTPAWGSENGKGGVLDKVRSLKNKLRKVTLPVVVALGSIPVHCALYEAEIDGVVTWFIECPEFFSENIYPTYVDSNAVRPFMVLNLAALELYRAVKWLPDVFHCHDWPTAILPIALAWHNYYSRLYINSKSVFTIHNLAHQGIFKPEDFFYQSGIDSNCFNPYGIEFYGSINLLKGAIIACRNITTVSPTYAAEIQTYEGGVGLDDVLRMHSYKLTGILNGIDTDYWDPQTDENIASTYSANATKLSGKKINRGELIKRCSWEDDKRPLIVCISRLAEQKGFDIMLPAVPRLAASGARYVFLGSGNPNIEEGLSFAQQAHPDEIKFFSGYDEELAHLIYSGGDMFLMPSLFEPCGLSQMISMRYGTVPIARAVGGLADTVFDVDSGKSGNGFLFGDYTQDSMLSAIERAIILYSDDIEWADLMKRGMKTDFTWNKSALSYLDIYKT
ncbi:MAG: glycogen synthase [Synergistaceae bacterium]|nr:glycogen synthase [Synergistaceae bacterium]